ncbi:UDP-galactopyranose mutase [Purpureocillium lavendulum]|uniref:UDP-galactopyranose mutase n=1 Tax=Purpureocillium lavendulum TaxID=1247861 RepID=A0AB34FTM0_9HYPO|nr:UDP-galactopyranose mutase [Purpureocillium lavendulum]
MSAQPSSAPDNPSEATACAPWSEDQLSDDQRELRAILRNLKQDPTLLGVTSLGKDGVLRTLTADRDVVDAVGLPPRLVKAMLDRTPYDPQNEVTFRGVDGTTVPTELWWHPDKSILPAPHVVSEERRREQEAKIPENIKLLEERRNRPGCGNPVRSDHDLGLKGDGQ